MANVLNSVSPAVFVPSGRDGNTLYSTFAKAGGQDQQALASTVSQFPNYGADFIISASTDTAAALTLIDLTAAGVTFPTGSQRIIMIDSWTKAAATNAAYKRTFAIVVGGSDPTLFISAQSIIGLDTTLDTELVFDVFINTATAPDSVLVRAATVPATALTHRVHVSVSQLLVI